jgi:peptidoglycan/xylan/chitin deacetylase (PgdA/CDA1 family)
MTYKEKFFHYLKNVYFKRVNSILVLFYHRVMYLETDPRKICINPTIFEDEIKYMKNNFNIISTSDMISFFKKGVFPKHSIIITFDDGYSDNYHIAGKILKKYNVPATFFITVGMIGSAREFWWDELEKIFLIDFDNFKPLEIFINNNRYLWDIKCRQDAVKPYNELIKSLRFLNSADRNRILKKLFKWSDKKRNVRDSHKVITKKELKSLTQSDLFTIGSHTVSHCSLASLSQEEQFFEISESKMILETIIENEVTGIAYPFGKKINIDKYTRLIAKKAGYKFGMSVLDSLVHKKSDLFFLPRYSIRSRSIDDFRKEIGQITNPKDIFDKIKNKRRLFI